MPSITSSKVYRSGDEPIFLAYVYHNTANGSLPFTRQEIQSVFVSHQVYKTGVKNGMVVKGWFPVEGNGILFDHREISTKVFLDTVVAQSGTAAFDRTDGRIFDYNFVYIPVNAPLYFRTEGDYRTIFAVTLTSGQVEIITFESKCEGQEVESVTLTGDTYDWGGKEQTMDVQFGEDITFVGLIYTKAKQENGTIIYPIKDNDFVGDVFLTIWDENNEPHLSRTSITKDVVLETAEAAPLTHNVKYTLPKQHLRHTGYFTLTFEIVGLGGDPKCQWTSYIHAT